MRIRNGRESPRRDILSQAAQPLPRRDTHIYPDEPGYLSAKPIVMFDFVPRALRRQKDPLDVKSDPADLKRRSAQGTLIIAAAQAAKFIVQFVSQIVPARLLLPEEFGLVAMIWPVIGAIQIFGEFGLGQLVIMRDQIDQGLVSSIFWLNLTITILIGFAVAMTAPLAAKFFNEPRLVSVLIVAGAAIPLSSIGTIANGLLVRNMRYSASAAIGILSAVIGFIATGIAAWSGWSYWSLIAGQYASTITSVLLACYASGWVPSRFRFDSSMISSIKFGGNFTGANLANYLTTASDNAIISYNFGSVALGLYDRSYRLVVQPIGQLLAPISTVAAPLLARMRGDPTEYERTYLGILHAVILLTVPGMAVCVVMADDVIAVLLGPRWAAAVPIFRWISVGGLVSATYTAAVWLLLSQERVAELMRASLIGAIVNIAAFLWGGRYGSTEIAAAGALSFIGVNVPLILLVALKSSLVRPIMVVRLLAQQYAFIGIGIFLLDLLRSSLKAPAIAVVGAGLVLSYAIMVGSTVLFAGQRQRLATVLQYVRRSRNKREQSAGIPHAEG